MEVFLKKRGGMVLIFDHCHTENHEFDYFLGA